MICVCGVDCTECLHLDNDCKGCETIKGKVYWAQYIGAEICPVYNCVEDHKFNNCGDCERIPCDKWYSLKDPAMSEEEHRKGIRDRVKKLKGGYTS
jgi:hypothetical protein